MNNGAVRIRTLQYSVPEKLHQYVQMIQPTIRFGQLTAERATAIKLAGTVEPQPDMSGGHGLNATFCNTTITPQCLRDLYNIGNFKANPHNGRDHESH